MNLSVFIHTHTEFQVFFDKSLTTKDPKLFSFVQKNK